MTKPRIIVWFSCGAPSACAAKETIRRYGESHEVVVVNCDTRPSEHSDNYRFSKEVADWIAQPIVYIANDKYLTVDEVFEKTKYMAGIAGARCTTELKKLPRLEYATPDDIHVFGFTVEESKRTRDFAKRNPELKLLWVLVDGGWTRSKCLNTLESAGIQLPAMYRLGFNNNNCPGCVKASSPWYWSMVRKHFPEVFKRRCEQSRKLGVRLVEISHHNRIFLDELPEREFKQRGKKENLSCGPECGGQPNLL